MCNIINNDSCVCIAIVNGSNRTKPLLFELNEDDGIGGTKKKKKKKKSTIKKAQ